MDEVRDRLVELAVRLLREGGRDAVRVRRLADELGTSTKAIYHHVGGMPQLMHAVAEEGFAQLLSAMRAVEPSRDPVADLGRLALAYRGFAAANPALYAVMYGAETPVRLRRTSRSPTAPNPVELTFLELQYAVERARDAGRIRPGAADLAGIEMWTLTHGYISLELSGAMLPERDLVAVFVPLGTNVLVGLGDERRRARRSLDSAVTAHLATRGASPGDQTTTVS
jgi:AcrR family transcriptional regulator